MNVIEQARVKMQFGGDDSHTGTFSASSKRPWLLCFGFPLEKHFRRPKDEETH